MFHGSHVYPPAPHTHPTPPQEMGLKAGQEASFAVQLNGARGLVDAKIHSPSGATEECYVSELDSGEMVSSVQSELGSCSSSS